MEKYDFHGKESEAKLIQAHPSEEFMQEISSLKNLPATVMLRDDLDIERLEADLAALSGSEFWALQRSFEDGAVGEESDVDWKVLPLRAAGRRPPADRPRWPGT